MSFPQGFLWGAATASFQVEGGADKRGECNWDLFCRTPNKVAFGHDGLTACDHYNRFREDVAIMKKLGLKVYRFSLSWARIVDLETGKLRDDGVRFYNELIDCLLENGIEPYITIYHWDLPIELQRAGGWLSPELPKKFADYTKTVVKLFSDRVSHWFTLNEELCFIPVSYANGEHAPGYKLSEEEVMLCGHHAHLAHGLAVQTIRQYAKKKPEIGIAVVGDIKIPATKSPIDIMIARKAMFAPCSPNYWGNAMWVDPIMTGSYNKEIHEVFEKAHIKITDEEMKIIGSEIDCLGLNIYQGTYIGKKGIKPNKVGFEQTAIGWPITPEAMYWGPKFLYEKYKKPIYITENGMANTDLVFSDGEVHDPQRIEFTTRYLKELKRASEDGVNIKGYFHWSLMDNFEWAEGYQKRFGLVYVDFETKKRILKDSAKWYKTVISRNGENL